MVSVTSLVRHQSRNIILKNLSFKIHSKIVVPVQYMCAQRYLCWKSKAPSRYVLAQNVFLNTQDLRFDVCRSFV